MNVRNQLRLINGIIAGVLLIAVILNIYTFIQLQNLLKSSNWILHTYSVTETINETDYQITNLESMSRGFAIAGNVQFLAGYEIAQKNLQENLQKLKQLTADNPRQASRVATLETFIQDKIAFIQTLIETRKSQGLNATLQLVTAGKGLELINQIHNILNQMDTEEKLLLETRTQTFQKNVTALTLFLLITNLTSGLLLLGSFIFLNIQFRRQIIAEEQRRATENLLKGIIDGSTDYIAALNMKYEFIAFNRSFAEEFKRIFGKEVKLGMSIKETLAHLPEEQKNAVEFWRRALMGEEYTVTSEFGDANLARDAYEIRYSSIRNSKEEIIGAAHIVRNVTKRVEAAAALKEANEKLAKGFALLKKHDTEISTINHMDNVLQACSTLEETFLPISIYCKKILPETAGILYMLNASKNYLEAVARWNEPKISEEMFTPDNCWALRQGKIYFYGSKEENMPCKHVPLLNTPAYYCVPLLAQNEIIGSLFIEINPTEIAAENSLIEGKHELLVTTLSEQISLALANIKLRETLKSRSIRDPLTNLYNRSYLTESLEREIHRAKREKIPLSVVMIDLDHFKQINDNFGHEAGDLILSEFGLFLFENIRKSDIACRYGGEEFLLLLYQTTTEEAFKRVDKIRKNFAKKDFNFTGKSIGHVTLSAGIAVLPDHGDDPEELISAADQALYAAKKAGRNNVVIYQKSTNK